MSITASMVAELRAKTGAGMMDCKKALTETGGNMEEAIDFLRKKGLSAAAKKADRVAAEGMVVAKGDASCRVVLEVNAETDFVARNAAFQSFAEGVADAIIASKPADVEALLNVPFPGGSRTVAEELTHQIATIGENMNIRRFALVASAGCATSYIHGAGKIGVVVNLKTDNGSNPRVAEVAHQIAMHVAAANPQFLKREEVPADVIEREKDIMRVKAKESGKPDNIIEKILDGQVNKFFGEICLVEQAFVVDPDLKISKLLENLGKEVGGSVELAGFVRYQLGEGIEKKVDNFAEEVASMSK